MVKKLLKKVGGSTEKLAEIKRQPAKYRKLVKDRFKAQEKQIKEKYSPKDVRKGDYNEKDKDSLNFFKKVRAYDKTGKKGSAIDYLAKQLMKKEESPANVERGMGTGYKKGGAVKSGTQQLTGFRKARRR